MYRFFPHFVSAINPVNAKDLSALNKSLQDYYNRNEISCYFEVADKINKSWEYDSPDQALRTVIKKGDRILDLGCGSAHALANLVEVGINYIGVDWSKQVLINNKKKFGKSGSFLVSSLYETGLRSEDFDVVFSLFVLEHTVWPTKMLAEMVRLTRPGGYLVINVPEYRRYGRIPSLYYAGKGSLREKLKNGRFLSASIHAILAIWYQVYLKLRFPRTHHSFLINLRPSCFSGEWSVDTDAVYLVDRNEIVRELFRLGAEQVETDNFVKNRFIRKNINVIIAKKRMGGSEIGQDFKR